MNFGTLYANSPIFLKCSPHQFPPHLIKTYRTLLYLSSIAENDAFSRHVKLVNMPFNKDRILIKNLYLVKGYTAQIERISK